MGKAQSMPDRQFTFGGILVVANRMDTLIERDLLKFGVTSKQWFLCVVIENRFDTPPTIKQVAKEMGSSHQNVKQVALKLEKKGLLRLVKDKRDARATRLVLTPESKEFWAQTEEIAQNFMKIFNKNITDNEFAKTRSALEKMMANLSEIENPGYDDVDEY